MKQIALILTLLAFSLGHSQAFKGKGDSKFQVGAILQSGGTGIIATYDFGLGENMSLGFTSNYILGVDSAINADFSDRFDVKARFNANIGNVLNIDENFDLYPGLSFGLRNFGGHIGLRYFFTSGFGIFTEFNAPIARYKTDRLTAAEELNNQFTFSVGASFNL